MAEVRGLPAAQAASGGVVGSVTAECLPGLVRHSQLDHAKLRELTDGRCPICDPTVTREQFGDVMRQVMRNPAGFRTERLAR